MKNIFSDTFDVGNSNRWDKDSDGTSFIDVSTDVAKSGAILKLIEDSEGTPITLWEVIIGAGNYSHSFITPIQVTKNKSISVEVDDTSAGSANIAGFETSH